MNTAIIGLGSNIKPSENIQKAKEILSINLQLLAESTFKLTQPIGDNDQDQFLNGAILVATKLNQENLKKFLKNLEVVLGRDAQDKSGPRTIDLDIIAWNNQIIDEDYYVRDFLKDSVRELLPDLK